MNSFNCPECGFKNWATALNCKRCKVEFETLNQFSTSNIPSNNSPQNHESRVVAPQLNAQWQSPRSSVQTNQYNPRPNSNYSSVNSDAKLKTASAITSLIFGIVGLMSFGLLFIFSIIGLILGIVALRNANKNPYKYGGKGMSIAGIVLNSLVVLMIPFVAIIMAIAIPNLLAARRAANEASAIATVRNLRAAEVTSIVMKLGCRDSAGLAQDQLISNQLSTNQGEKYGYKFTINTSKGCEIQANPLTDMNGTRSFYTSTDDEGIHYSNAKISVATAKDPILGETNAYRSR